MNARDAAVAELERAVGHRFRDRDLLEQALTHPGVGHGARKVASNQRMEYLGDRVLGLIVAEALYARFPDLDEGELTKRFTALVDGETCARVARRIGVGPALRMAAGDSKLGARDNVSVLGDACEALIAAVHLDGGFEAARERFLALWEPEIAEGRAAAANPKSMLQEWAAREGGPPPAYAVLDRKGPDHAPVFTVEARVGEREPVRAEGRSRQEAEKAAATALLIREGIL